MHRILDFIRATNSIDDARELDKETVASGLDDATAVLGNLDIDDLLAMLLEARKGALLVGIHEA